MVQMHDRDLHTEGGMLDYSIRGSLAPSILPGSYGWIGGGGSYSMVLELRSCV
jgi:hypothetical protein